MKQLRIVSLFILFVSSFSSDSKCKNSSFLLTYDEDKKAFHGRHFHIFYERGFESQAETLKCQVADTVKEVSVEEIKGKTLKEICASSIYSSKLEDKTKKRNYMTTITKQETYSEENTQCDALNQLNLIQTPQKKWAVLIRGFATNIILPVKSKNGVFTKEGLDFALNSLFFATAYGFGDSTFKSLGGETGVKGVGFNLF
uniref:Lipoprotein n=1 Tax=Caenorhabditis tropicalis TaxID=1561998 RepID=A0A1I7TSA8_9PELO